MRKKPQIHARPAALSRLTILAVLAVAAACALTGCSGEQRFEFIVQDDEGALLSGVGVYYYDNQDSISVGHTDSLGSIIIHGEHLQTARQYMFHYEPPAASKGPRFEPQLCSILSAAPEGKYYSHRRDGTLAPGDLSGQLADRKWPGRRITLEFVPDSYLAPAEDNADGIAYPLQRILKLDTTPGAGIIINGELFRRVPPSGKLTAPFCPGDSAACFAPTVQIMLTKDYHKEFNMEMTLPDPGDTLVIRQRLRAEDEREDRDQQAEQPATTTATRPVRQEPPPVVEVQEDVEVVITAVRGPFFVNATVFIDGQEQPDKTPYTFYLKPGSHEIRAVWEENGVTQEETQTISAAEGMTPKVVFRFEE